MTLNAREIYFSAFSHQYIESCVFLEVARKGAIAPITLPLNPPLCNYSCNYAHSKIIMLMLSIMPHKKPIVNIYQL